MTIKTIDNKYIINTHNTIEVSLTNTYTIFDLTPSIGYFILIFTKSLFKK